MFEIVCRSLYRKFYTLGPTDTINIFNFLSLDEHLKASDEQLVLIGTLDPLVSNPEICHPFGSVKGMAPKYDDHSLVPNWWKAYNDVKHSNTNIDTAATLGNSLAAVAALFVLLHRVYGYGLVYGVSRLPHQLNSFATNARSSLLFSPTR